MSRKPSAKQLRILKNVRAGRLAQHGFTAERGASLVLGTVLEAGWLVHSREETGPAFLLTLAGIEALGDQMQTETQ